ncbi:MAG: prepilin-type N-terminal cleavage/methylation domain-containing protein [Myxococcota bacterium]|nr:prepilin-type N-terminal cleavage/methylation domain-containing protein [Myxococcota bacterium]
MVKMRTQLGFSLIEVLVVTIIAAVAVTGVALSLGAMSQSRLRSSCWMIVAAARYAYSHSVTRGMTTRLVMDFEDKTIHLEETSGRVVLNREDETGEGLRREDEALFDPDGGPKGRGLLDFQMNSSAFGTSSSTGGAGGLQQGMGIGAGLGMGLGMGGQGEGQEGDMFSMMANFTSGALSDPFLASMQRGLSGGSLGYRKPKFSPLGGRRGEKRSLEGDTTFVTVFTPHAPKPQEEGRAFVYFFPGGMTEHAIIQVSDGDERIYSVEIHPMTGRAVIHNEPIEPDGELDDLQEAE